MCIVPIDLIVVPTSSVTIVIPPIRLLNKRCFDLEFCLTGDALTSYFSIVGNEPVFIQAGVAGTPFQLLDNVANIFFADKLLLGRCYRIKYGNNGMPALIPHFINLNTPKCSRAFDPGNAPVVESVTTQTISTTQAKGV